MLTPNFMRDTMSQGWASVSVLGMSLCVPTELVICREESGTFITRGVRCADCDSYANSDYIFASQRCHTDPRLKTLFSYDINCQYCKKFPPRMLALPSYLRFVAAPSLFVFSIPKLHVRGHRTDCGPVFSLNYLFGAGQTDGEGVERAWAMMGPVATSTKEMGPGHRRDTLDDHWGYWNWTKLFGLGKSQHFENSKVPKLPSKVPFSSVG
jgi:hypothetical protein